MAGAGGAHHKLSNVLPSPCHESEWSSLPALPHLLRWLTLRLSGVQLSGPFSGSWRSWAAVPLPTWHRALMTGEPLPLCSARRPSSTFQKTGTCDCPSSYVNQSEAGGRVRGQGVGGGGYKAVKAGGAFHSCPGCISEEGSESTECFESAKKVRGECPEEAERGSPGSSVYLRSWQQGQSAALVSLPVLSCCPETLTNPMLGPSPRATPEAVAGQGPPAPPRELSLSRGADLFSLNCSCELGLQGERDT